MLACIGSRTKAMALAATAAGSFAAVGVGSSAAAAGPAANCQPYSQTPCLLPFPNNVFTRPDRTTPTGLRVHLPASAMPANNKGRAIAVAEHDRNDGFSPGSAVIVHVPGLDTSHLYYDGSSQGGIMGGMMTAVAPDFRRAVLGVSGMNYANVLVQRSTDFAPFGTILGQAYPDRSLTPVILDLMQQLWDRGDPDGYAQHMTSHPLPDTPSHTVLMQIAYGDHQVSMYAAAVEARTIGASVHVPALDPSRARDENLFFGVPSIARYPFNGSAITIWDDGPGNVQPPPLANLAPTTSPTNKDPHEDVRNTVAARTQKSDFLEPNGAVVDVCAGKPCHTDVFKP
jgi:hypothetical protein